MPSTGSHARQLPPSSLPTRLVRRCLPTSATRALQAGVGPCPFRRRPLSGCRLSRKTFPAALSVHWPWSPSLPAPYSSARLGPSFDGFPVPRDHPTSLVPSPSRPFVLDGYHPLGGGREISLGKQRKTSCPCRRHYSRLPDGYWVRRRLPASPQDVRLPAFRSRSAWHFTIDFHQTPPRGPHPSDPTTAPLSHRCEVPSARALRGLSSSLHLLFCAHARRTKILVARNLFPQGSKSGYGTHPAVRFFLVVRKNLTKGFLPPIDGRDGGPGSPVVSFISFVSLKSGDVAPSQPLRNCIQLHRCNWMEGGVGTGDGRATTNRVPRDAKCVTSAARAGPKCHTLRHSHRRPLRPVARATDRFARFARFV